MNAKLTNMFLYQFCTNFAKAFWNTFSQLEGNPFERQGQSEQRTNVVESVLIHCSFVISDLHFHLIWARKNWSSDPFIDIHDPPVAFKSHQSCWVEEVLLIFWSLTLWPKLIIVLSYLFCSTLFGLYSWTFLVFYENGSFARNLVTSVTHSSW